MTKDELRSEINDLENKIEEELIKMFLNGK